jgi:hypothetical protein
VIPLFYNPLISGFQTPLRKLDKGDIYMSPFVYENITKALLLYLKLFSTSPWHDPY